MYDMAGKEARANHTFSLLFFHFSIGWLMPSDQVRVNGGSEGVIMKHDSKQRTRFRCLLVFLIFMQHLSIIVFLGALGGKKLV
jgi:hypothetical protein